MARYTYNAEPYVAWTETCSEYGGNKHSPNVIWDIAHIAAVSQSRHTFVFATFTWHGPGIALHSLSRLFYMRIRSTSTSVGVTKQNKCTIFEKQVVWILAASKIILFIFPERDLYARVSVWANSQLFSVAFILDEWCVPVYGWLYMSKWTERKLNIFEQSSVIFYCALGVLYHTSTQCSNM